MGYLEIAIIFVGAIGAALVVGTGAALVRYRRTGAFPNQPGDASREAVRGALRGSVLKLVIGVALVAAGLRMLASVGVFG